MNPSLQAILGIMPALWGAVLCCVLPPPRAPAAETAPAEVVAPAAEEPASAETEPTEPATPLPDEAPPDAGVDGPSAEPAIEQPPSPGEPPPEPTEPPGDSTEPPGSEAEPPEAPGDLPPTPTEPPEDPAATPATLADESKPETLRFSFSYQPWSDVLEWFAEQNDLSMVLDTAPSGTFNYRDNREYTPAEALDLLNSVLLTKGYTLVRRDRMLFVVNLEDGIPPNLVPTVPVEDLDKRGEYELVSVVFPVQKLSPAEAEEEITKLIGPPPSSVQALEKSRQVMVTATAGRLRVIRSMLDRIENPQGASGGKLRSFDLKYALPEEVLPIVRKLCGIDEDEDAAEDGSLRLAVDPVGGRLLVTGQPERIAEVEEILKAVDLPGPGESGATPAAAEQPQLEVYAIHTADPQAVLAVMQTLMAGMPDVRLSIDPQTNNLIALARPSQHGTIRATLDQMQQERRMIEVIQLHTVDPQVAVLSINKLFSQPGAEKDKPSPNAPQVDADPIRRQLFVHGTQAQIAQIQTLLEKMGEGEAGEDAIAEHGNLRIVPIEGSAAQAALQRAREIWPSLRANPIRVVTPSSVIPTIRPSTPPWNKPGSAEVPEQAPPAPVTPRPPAAQPPSTEPEPAGEGPLEQPEPTSTTGRAGSARVFFAVQQVGDDAPPDAAAPAPEPESPFVPEGPPAPAPAPPSGAEEAPAIVVIPGPGGLMIASQDTKALDDFEELLNTLAGEMMTGSTELTVFYLKHAKATVVAETLNRIFGGGAAGGSGAGATPAGGPGAGGGMDGLLGAMMGGLDGLGITPTGSISITPDTRLNALIVQANAADVATVEQLLKILDQRESPEDVLAAPKARMIPVFNTQAEEIAEIVKEVYQDRLLSGSGGRGGAPSPQQIYQAMRAMRGRGGTQNNAEAEQDKMSVGVDPRTNSLVVVAPDALFQEVKQLVEQLDQAALESSQTVRVVTLGRASPAAVQQALSSLLGGSVQVGVRSGSSGGTTTTQPSPGSPQPTPQPFFRPPWAGGGPPSGSFPFSRFRGSDGRSGGSRSGGSDSGRSGRGSSRPGGSGR